MVKYDLNEFIALDLESYVLVDTRLPEVFGEGFIKESVSLPFGESFIESLQELVSGEMKVLIIADESEIPGIIRAIKNSGMSNVAGYLAGGYKAWADAGKEIDMLISIDASEFAMDYQFDEFYLIDIRNKEDFDKTHVEDAENITLFDLEPLLAELENQHMYYIYGATAADAVTAGSLLRRNGFNRVRPVASDFEAIQNSGVPMFVPKKKDKPTPNTPQN